jgi:post-segregation antitoxin (ccd killing protein)
VARLTVYVPDELADAARARGLNISVLTRVAIAAALERTSMPGWLDPRPAPIASDGGSD